MNRYDAIIIGARCGGAPLAMLLAGSGHKVLLLDKMAFGTDILSTHYLKRTGTSLLHKWGLLDAVRKAGTPAIGTQNFHLDGVHLRGIAPPHVNSTDAISVFIGAFLGSVPLAQVFPPHLMERFAADVVRGHEENRYAA